MILHFKRNSILVIFLIFILFLTWIFLNNKSQLILLDKNKLTTEWFSKNCFAKQDEKDFNLDNLNKYIHTFQESHLVYCNEIANRFHDIFKLEESYGEIQITKEFSLKIKSWLNNDLDAIRKAKKQKIIKLFNKFLHEEMIYNALRGKRPQVKNELSEKNYSENLLKSSLHKCDFCDKYYLKNTASDIFGRIETELSYTAANTFKYDKWHSLIVSRNHDTLNLSEPELIDMFRVAMDWFKKVNKLDSQAQYPQLLWDAMPKSGASQVHTHLQSSMGFGSYYGYMERHLNAFNVYKENHGRDYLDDFILIHQALGQAIKINNTYVLVNLIPVKEYELMIINTDNEFTDDISRVLHRVIRVMVDKYEKYSFSMGMYLPKIKLNSELKYTICRIVFRTPVSNLRSDINGLDLYTSSVVGIDRFEFSRKFFSLMNDFLVK